LLTSIRFPLGCWWYSLQFSEVWWAINTPALYIVFLSGYLLIKPQLLYLTPYCSNGPKIIKMWSSPCPRHDSIHSSTHSYPRSCRRANIGPQRRSGHFGVQKNLLPLLGPEPRSVKPLAKWLHLLRYPVFKNGLRLAELQRWYVQGSYSLSCHYMCWQSQLVTVTK